MINTEHRNCKLIYNVVLSFKGKNSIFMQFQSSLKSANEVPHNKTKQSLPCSLPKATNEPVKVMPPIYVPRKRNVLIMFAAGSVAK